MERGKPRGSLIANDAELVDQESKSNSRLKQGKTREMMLTGIQVVRAIVCERLRLRGGCVRGVFVGLSYSICAPRNVPQFQRYGLICFIERSTTFDRTSPLTS